jgi:predicted ATPase/serine phosphatase RsbU (regulator of sigma subunit)/tRNA A-37 threonylcarbamoyl transferase component Bud32
MIKIPNYQIHTQIDESINSLVYRGVRKTDNQPVIIKILKKDYPTQEELTSYRQEYNIIRQLTKVDGVIKAYDLEKYQNTLVIILEDFGGQSLKHWRAERTFTLEELLRFAIRTTEILGQIHRQNIIHQDINPFNIIWNPNTEVLKIIDFGISTQLSKQYLMLKNPDVLEGTLVYMSPEQTGRMNRALDYRTDFYSLGATFYELLTGKVPFESTDAMELVHCHIAKMPVPICEVNPNVPPIISEIVMKLMAKNAEDRYQSAWGIKADLEKCQENLPGLNAEKGFSFELAQHDFSEHFQIPEKLYGRESEINTLLSSFERVAAGKAEIMLVTGYSGIGKSVLVKEIYQSLSEKHGYFISGKFDQFQRNIPYSALVNAFFELVQQLLTENNKQLAVWKKKLLKALEPNGQVIIDVIPEIEWIIGKQPAIPQLGLTESQNRFNLVFQNFIQVFCQPAHPLVIFLDDLQWIDSATLKLLELVMTAGDNTVLFLIGAYRDNEVEPTHPLMTTLNQLREKNVTINQITLKPLAFEDINQLIAESLQQNLKVASSLTDLVMRKTGGNPFFVNQFLHTLYEEDLLHFTFPDSNLTSLNRWTWDIDQIEALNITDNVVDLMISKLKKLPEVARQVLRLAACIGNRFDLNTLSVIYEKSVTETFQDLIPILTEGFILPTSSLELNEEEIQTSQPLIYHFRFLHDRVQQAAYSLIDELEKKFIHLKIGRLLLANTKADNLEEHIFKLVNQFNQAIALVDTKVEKYQLAKFNLLAGQKAKTATAYQSAFDYLQTGIQLFDNTAWQQHYTLALQLYSEMAEIAYLNGDFEAMAQGIHTVLQQAQTTLDKVKVYELKIQSAIAKNQMLTAIEIGQQLLEKLGISLSQSPPPDLPIETFYHLPEMTATDKLVAMQIAMAIFSPTYIATPQKVPQLVFTMVILCLNEGNSPLAAFAYVLYGLLLCSGLGDIERGYQFGQLALNLLEKFHAIHIKCRVDNLFNVTIRHWKEHARHAIKAFEHGVQLGLETGDIEYTAYHAMVYCENSCLIGERLDLVSEKQRAYVALIQKIKQEFQLYGARIATQFVVNLSGQTVNPLRLDGELLREQEITSLLQNTDNATILFRFYFAKAILSYLLKDHKNAMSYVQLAKNYAYALAGTLPVAHLYFYESLIFLAYKQAAEPEISIPAFKQVIENQNQLKEWASHAPMNFQHKYDLVEAEKARILGQDFTAIDFYEKAIAGAKENEYLNEEALAYELAAQFYFGRGMEKFAQTYLKEAHYCYQQWGALAIVTDLERRYPQLIVPKTASSFSMNTTIFATQMVSTKGGEQWLDLNSLMKAAQTLSEEIVLSRLLEKMMRIVIENAGASIGFLLLPQNDNWFIEAQGQVDSDKVHVLQSIPLEPQLIAQTIIQYVIHTQENVVLNNATQENRFSHDAYTIKQHPKSVLCAPLVNQGKLIGILYLENNLTEGAFTPKRLEVLKVLSSQIAISIENALLYRTLEQKVEERTAQLAETNTQLANANKEISTLNKQLKSENLRMSAELEVSRQLQQMLLPKDEELKAIDDLDIAGFMEPADEIGGDYYDVLQHQGRILFGIGDVTGHGLESGVLTIMVQSSIRTLLANNETDPVKFFSALNQMVYHNGRRMNAEKNLTLVLINYQNQTLYLSGQHEEIIVVRSGELELIDTLDLGFPIGLDENIAKFVHQIKVPLNAGDVVVLYTDGITEAENLDQQMYGLERLCEIAQARWQQTAHEIQQAVIEDVHQFIGEQKVFDDITLLVLKQK